MIMGTCDMLQATDSKMACHHWLESVFTLYHFHDLKLPFLCVGSLIPHITSFVALHFLKLFFCLEIIFSSYYFLVYHITNSL